MENESREVFEKNRLIARSHGYIALLIFSPFIVILVLGFIFIGFQSGAVFLIIGLVLVPLPIAEIVVAVLLKERHDKAVAFVKAWYLIHPEDDPAFQKETMARIAVANATKVQTNTPSITDELIKAKSLLDSGSITEEEYQRIKEKLLS